MTTEIVSSQGGTPNRSGTLTLPAIIAGAGEDAIRRFLEYFTADIRNKNTRAAYARAVGQFFAWLDSRGITELRHIEPIVIAAYVEQHPGSIPSQKQALSAIKKLFDWLVVGQVLPFNPAASVRGPRYSLKRGLTPVLDAEQARQLLDSITTDTIAGLRDRAMIGVMVFSFARVGAVVGLDIDDYFQHGKRWWLRLHEKGSKVHEVPAHHNAEDYLDAYLEAANLFGQKKTPLFRTIDSKRRLTESRMQRTEVLRMIKRRAKAAGLPESTCCHTFRATGITVYLLNGGTIEKAQQIAGHESPRTTKLYDRTSDVISLDEVERIVI